MRRLSRQRKGTSSARSQHGQSAAPGQPGKASPRREPSVRVLKICQHLDTQRGSSELAGDYLGQRPTDSRSGGTLASKPLELPVVPRLPGPLKLVLERKKEGNQS